MEKIKVLIVDDSALMRKVLKRVIEEDKSFEVIASARDGIDAVVKARDLRPDVITMDINMPNLDGLTALQVIVDEHICPVVVVSSITTQGALVTFEALELGAFDYVEKPGGTISSRMESVIFELRKKLKAAVRTKNKSRLYSSRIIEKREEKRKDSLKKSNNTDYKAVVIGISTGGPKTIYDVLPHLPAELNAVVFLIQHMPPNFTLPYAQRLNNYSHLEVKECEASDKVMPGMCYVGKGGSHLTLYKKSNNDILIRTPSLPEHLFKPSVDVCMESVLKVFSSDTIGVLMTGMGEDGAKAMVNIKQAGGQTIAESEESAIVFGMPQRAIQLGGADFTLPSWEIADKIIKLVKG